MSAATASDLNWVSGLTVPNLTVVGIGPGSQVNAYNFAGSVDLVIDVVGYFSGIAVVASRPEIGIARLRNPHSQPTA